MDTATSATRVASRTSEESNERIYRATRMRIDYFERHPEEIDDRLKELDAEWDTERALELNAASLVVAGTVMGVVLGRRWLLLPLTVGGFLVQHALHGWCPPLPALRRMGVRTPREIEAERYALMILRGDFDSITEDGDERARLAADATGRLEEPKENGAKKREMQHQ
jgi:hypothetical protein